MTDITERLRAVFTNDDHGRGCQGREYSCTCGYDDRVDAVAAAAADEIERLRAALKPFAKEWDERERLAEAHWSWFQDAAAALRGQG